MVHRTPLHRGFGNLIPHHEFIFGRPSRELAGANHKRAPAGETPLAPLYGMLQQLDRPQIPISHVDVPDSERFQAVAAGVNFMIR